jgi:probable HAF family extracellular repeat protein
MAVFTFTTLPNPGFAGNTDAADINAAGQIVGSYQDATSKTHGYLLSGGIFTTINDPLATAETVATGINDMAQIVGWYFHTDASGSGYHGFLYSNGTYTTLVDPSFPTATPRHSASTTQAKSLGLPAVAASSLSPMAKALTATSPSPILWPRRVPLLGASTTLARSSDITTPAILSRDRG